MRMLLWFLLGYVGFRIVQGLLAGRREPAKAAAAIDTETFRDPVCGVYVTAGDAVIGRVETERIYFCSAACREKYRTQLNQQ